MIADFHGFATRTLQNDHLRLDYLDDAGPRLVRLFLAGSQENLLADAFDITFPTPYGEYLLLGGHRLWHAPESLPRSYIPDTGGLTVEELPGGMRLSRPPEILTGIAKALEVRLDPQRPALTLRHTLRNDGAWPVELAPWAVTQLPLGGTAVLPLPSSPLDPQGLLPDRQLSFWPYTSLQDPRLIFTDEAILVRAAARLPPIKIGAPGLAGWLAFWRAGVLFVKRFEHQTGATYPDQGSSAELYCGDRFIELESLGPLARLEPGQSVDHLETWELYTTLDVPFISPLLKSVLAP
jgi:hypothetical protein